MILLFLALLTLSAMLASSETSLFSLGKVARSRLTGSKKTVDRIIAKLLDKPRDLLVTIVVGNELTNLAISVVGASIVVQMTVGKSLAEQALIAELTVLPLLVIFGEITPKIIASRRAETVARLVARPFSWVKVLLTPIRVTLRMLADILVSRLGGPTDSENRTIAESEFRAMIDVGHRDGVVEHQERTLIHNVLDFGDIVVTDIMQPFEKVLSFSEQLPVAEAIQRVVADPHSRIPLWSTTPRNVTGLIFAKELLAIHWGVKPPTSLRRLKHPVLFCPPSRLAAELLEEFRRTHMHLAIVVDEFGQAQGLVTMEDLLEELVGPISDDQNEVEHE